MKNSLLLQRNFEFTEQGQRQTPVTGRKGVMPIIQLLRGKRAAKFRERTAELVEKYKEADMGLADDITDRAWDAAVRDARHCNEQRERQADHHASTDEGTELHKRIKSRDSAKTLGAALEAMGADKICYGVMKGGVNQAVAGMPTKTYRRVQVNLRPKEAAREAFTECMTGLVNTKVADNQLAGKAESSGFYPRQVHPSC